MRRQRLELYELPDYVPRKNKSNDYGFDPHEQEHETYTGMGADINVHDQWACESMGAIQDRTREHLGQSDKAITAYRRLLRQAIEDSRQRRQAADGARCAAGAEHHRPGRVDGIGPADDWQGYWQKTDASKRKPRAGRMGVSCMHPGQSPRRRGTYPGRAWSPLRGHDRRRCAPRRHRSSFVERHDLWSDEQRRAARGGRAARSSSASSNWCASAFADQHGVLRGKTLVAAEAAQRDAQRRHHDHDAARQGHLASHGVSGVHAGRRLGPATRCRAPAISSWSPTRRPSACCRGRTQHRLDAVRHLFPERQAGAVLDAAALSRRAGEACASRLRLSRRARGRIPSVQARRIRGLRPTTPTWPPRAAGGRAHHHGFQYLTEVALRSGRADPGAVWRETSQALGMPLRSLEVELGPSQYEFTFAPELGLAAADTMVLFRSADEAGRAPARPSRQLHVPAAIAQRVLQRLASASVAARSRRPARTRSSRTTERELLSPLGRHYLGGPARACARRRGVHHADHQRLQALSRRQLAGARSRRSGRSDNRGVMVRVLGRARRSGDASGEPRRRAARQSVSLHGLADPRRPRRHRARRDPGPSADTPYETEAPALPKTLGEALAALRADASFRTGFGAAFVDYYVRIKDAEIARFTAEAGGETGATSPPGSTTNISICFDRSLPPCGESWGEGVVR